MYVGYRGWSVRNLNGEPTLISPYQISTSSVMLASGTEIPNPNALSELSASSGIGVGDNEGKQVLTPAPVLTPITEVYAWGPGANVAQCSYCDMSLDADCHCGLYALCTTASLASDLDGIAPNVDILGQVIMWGKLVKGSLGFRAKRATISLLFLPSIAALDENILNRLALKYRVPLVKINDPVLLNTVSEVRVDRLITQGKLKPIWALRQYKKDNYWRNKREEVPDPYMNVGRRYDL